MLKTFLCQPDFAFEFILACPGSGKGIACKLGMNDNKGIMSGSGYAPG